MKTNMLGQRFGMLEVVETTDQRKNGYMVYRCRCDCGNDILVDYRKLKRGTALDCGCQPMRVKVDLRGRRFGKLVALEPLDRSGERGRYWHCQCDCGGTVEAPSGQLLAGYRRSCGCLSHPPLKDYDGKQFGELLVLSHAGKKNGVHMWHCRCTCGRELDVSQSNLQSGHTTSCGCKNDIRNSIHVVGGTCVELIRSDKLMKTNRSGIKGVHWSKKQQRWIGQLTFQGKTYHLGSFKNIEDAAYAREKAQEETFEPFLNWYDKLNEEAK